MPYCIRPDYQARAAPQAPGIRDRAGRAERAG